MSSTDSGESWTLLPIGIDNITAIAEFDGNVYVKGEKNRVSRLFRLSADDDKLTRIPGIPAFEKVTRNVTANLPFPVSRFKIIAFAGSTLYVATDKGVIYSRDGINWHETIGVNGAVLVIDKFAVDGPTVYGISDIHAHPARHVYQLKKDANTWKQVTPEIPNRVTSLVVEGKTLYIGTIGRGVLRFTLAE